MSYYRGGGYGAGGYGDGGYGVRGYSATITKPTSVQESSTRVQCPNTRQGPDPRDGCGGGNPNQAFLKYDPRKLFVGGVSRKSTTEVGFKEFFEKYGEIEHAYLNRVQDGEGHRGFGFVTFKEQSAAEAVMADAGKLGLDGRKLDAKLALPPSLKPPPGTETNKLFIGSLPIDGSKPTPLELKAHFSAFGEVEDTWVSEEKGFGFVTFKHENGAYKALAQTLTGGHLVNENTKIDLKWPKPKIVKGSYGGGVYTGGGCLVAGSYSGYGSYNGKSVPSIAFQGRFQPY